MTILLVVGAAVVGAVVFYFVLRANPQVAAGLKTIVDSLTRSRK